MKIFGIGFHKTGTTSLSNALRCLGYRVHGGVTSEKVSSRSEAKRKAREICKKYDALQDMPWPVMYKWFDREYEDSKFILTIRDEKSWIKSVCKHFGNRSIKRHKLIYGKGDPIGNKKLYIDRYKRHNKEVINYFGDRRGKDLLVIDITKGDGWKKICPFLGKKIPVVPFPKSNMSPEEWRKSSVKRRLRRKLENSVIEITALTKRSLRLINNSDRYIENIKKHLNKFKIRK